MVYSSPVESAYFIVPNMVNVSSLPASSAPSWIVFKF